MQRYYHTPLYNTQIENGLFQRSATQFATPFSREKGRATSQSFNKICKLLQHQSD